jgi:hypothetical protein
MDHARISTQTHRFWDDVAIYMGRGPCGNDKKGIGLTVYLSPDDAETFAKAILANVENVRTRKYTDSGITTHASQFEGKA